MSEVNENYQDREALLRRPPDLALPAAEAVRGGADTVPPAVAGRGGASLLWCVVGCALLGIAGLVVASLYQRLTSSANDLRHDVARLKEARGELIKKDEFNARMNVVWNGLNDAREAGAGVAAVRDKQAFQEQQFRQADEQRREMIRELQLLRERVALLEGQAAGPKPTAASNIPD